jgi:RNA polymerase sigma-70 factor (ECF subfamily)
MVLSENDWDLIEACQRGDQTAFAVLFEHHSDKVYSIALRYVGDEAAAMDIAQDTFLKLLSQIGQFRSDAKFDTWLYRLVINSCLEHQRRKRRVLPILDGLLESISAIQNSVLQELLRQERQNTIQEIVGKLPPEQRVVVILRYTEELSYEEIAEIVGCSPGTVASRLNRAHRVLERRLAHLRRQEGSGRG